MACMTLQVSDAGLAKNSANINRFFRSRFDARRFHCEAYHLERTCRSDNESCTGLLTKPYCRSYHFLISRSACFKDGFTGTELRIS